MEYRDSCYKAVTNQMSFAEAEAQCAKQVMRYSIYISYRMFSEHLVCLEIYTMQGADVHLMSLRDVAEEDFSIVFSYAGEEGDSVWLGLRLDGDKWGWSDGWPVQYTNWQVKQADRD